MRAAPTPQKNTGSHTPPTPESRIRVRRSARYSWRTLCEWFRLGLAGSVAPMSCRTFAMASGPSSTMATMGPEDMNWVKPAKNGRSRWNLVEPFRLPPVQPHHLQRPNGHPRPLEPADYVSDVPPRTASGFTITNVRSTMPSPCLPRPFVLREVRCLPVLPALAAMRAGRLPSAAAFRSTRPSFPSCVFSGRAVSPRDALPARRLPAPAPEPPPSPPGSRRRRSRPAASQPSSPRPCRSPPR